MNSNPSQTSTITKEDLNSRQHRHFGRYDDRNRNLLIHLMKKLCPLTKTIMNMPDKISPCTKSHVEMT